MTKRSNPRTTSQKRAGIYVRISRDRANETSTDVQESKARALAHARGYTVADSAVYVDAGRSGWKVGTPRPAFDRLHDDVEAGLIDVVISFKLDRIARNVGEFARFVDFLDSHGAAVTFTDDQGLDTTGASGRLMRTIISAFAQFESDVKSERIQPSMEVQARQGKPHPGRYRTFGYSHSLDEVNLHEAKLIRDAAKRVVRGESLASITKRWNERGVTTVDANPLPRVRRQS